MESPRLGARELDGVWMLKVKRVYEPATEDDGYRILVDRVWPRGFTKERARVDEWRRDLGTSDALRKWYGHDPAKWEEFLRRYRAQLEADGTWADLMAIAERAEKENVTLIFGSKDLERNQAVALRELALRR
jgi:uncharacterized protein YeaO (DUF488 family)